MHKGKLVPKTPHKSGDLLFYLNAFWKDSLCEGLGQEQAAPTTSFSLVFYVEIMQEVVKLQPSIQI